VIFADECIIGTYWNNGQVWVQRRVGEEMLPENIADKNTNCVKINVWACVAANGVGTLYTFTETLDGQYYKDILDKCLLESVDHLLPDVGQWYFLHDNSTVHGDGRVRSWLFNHGVTVLDFPPYSPDLNAIEHVWVYLKKAVENLHPKTLEELQDAVHSGWEAIPEEYLEAIVHSMPRRLQQVREAGGYRIRC
jgi:tRNA A-37 threonylcarbamoyl transferase component Bud32